MSAPTLAEVLAPHLDEAKQILPILKNARVSPGYPDPKYVANSLERFITDIEQRTEAPSATNARTD
jgi:hypothetical protein